MVSVSTHTHAHTPTAVSLEHSNTLPKVILDLTQSYQNFNGLSFTEEKNLTFKFTWNGKGPQEVKTILKKKKLEDSPISNLLLQNLQSSKLYNMGTKRDM